MIRRQALEAHDDQGDVVASAAADTEAGEQHVGQAFGSKTGVAGEGVGEPAQTDVDVLPGVR